MKMTIKNMIIKIVFVKFIILSVLIALTITMAEYLGNFGINKIKNVVCMVLGKIKIVVCMVLGKIKNVVRVIVTNIKNVVRVLVGNIKIVVSMVLGSIKNVVSVVLGNIKIVVSVAVIWIKKVIGVIRGYLKAFIRRVLNSILLITLDKIFGLFLAAIFLASLKYAISGCLWVNWEDFNLNFSLAFFGGLFRSIVKELSFEYLNLKGINYNIHQIFFGLNKHRIGSDHDLGEFKPRLYNPMDIDEEPSLGKSLDKGKGVSEDSDRMSIGGDSDNDRPLNKGKGVSQDNNSSDEDSNGNKTKRLDKGKGVDRNMHPNHPSVTNDGIIQSTVSIFGLSNTPNPGHTTAYMPNFPPKTNPGPGFNVPGGVVPIRDDICKCIEYNSHVLRQFRTMDLETAIEQRDNNLKMIEVLNKKLEFGRIKLATEGIGEVPKNEFQAWLKAKVAAEAQWLNERIAQGDGRQTLLLSRIEYILIEESKKNK